MIEIGEDFPNDSDLDEMSANESLRRLPCGISLRQVSCDQPISVSRFNENRAGQWQVQGADRGQIRMSRKLAEEKADKGFTSTINTGL